MQHIPAHETGTARIREFHQWHQQADQVAQVRAWLARTGGTLEDLETKFRELAHQSLTRAADDYTLSPVDTNDQRWVTPL